LKTCAMAPVALSNGSSLLRWWSFSTVSALAGAAAPMAKPAVKAAAIAVLISFMCRLPSWLQTEQSRNEQREIAPVGDCDENTHLDQDEWPQGCADPLDGFARDRRKDEQTGAHRRCHQRDVERQNDHDAGVNRIHADAQSQRREDRR